MTLDKSRLIAKNALALYLRMLLSMAVLFYTSRIVLQTLGVEDYGIYSITGGVVMLFGFLNASMSGATSRFFAFELGRGDEQKLKETFSSALFIHICIALVVCIAAETIGLWFLEEKMVIPETRMTAARWVYQFSVLTTIIGIIQTPYIASLIAHEKINVYAYIEILNVTLKLLIVYLLVLGHYDKLIVYGALILCIQVIIACIYRFYCTCNFGECHFKWERNKSVLRPMLSFSGWELYGNLCITARLQGTSMLLNLFAGALINAATGIATSVNNMTSQLAYNVITAFRPQIIKNYSIGNKLEFETQINNAMKFSAIAIIALTIPVYLDADYLFRLWLKDVPDYTVTFCKITMLSKCIVVVYNALMIGVQATGEVKRINCIAGTIYLIELCLSYLFLRAGMSPAMVYWVQCGGSIVILFSTLGILKILIRSFSLFTVFINILKIALIAAITAILASLTYNSIINHKPLFRLLIICIVTFIFIGTFSYYLLLNYYQRQELGAIVSRKLHALSTCAFRYKS